MSARILALLLIMPGMVGCIGTDQPPAEASPATGLPRHGDLFFRDPVQVSATQPGAEPVIDLASDGTVFLQGIGPEPETTTGQQIPANNVWRSSDGGATWEDVTPPAESGLGADSLAFVGPGDTVLVANDARGSHLSIWRSTDLGDTWVRSGHVPLPGPVHRMWLDADHAGVIHVVVLSLPTLGVLPAVGDDEHLGAWHTSSADRGATWSPATQISGKIAFGSDLEIGPDGGLNIVSLEAPADGDWEVQNEGEWVLYRSTDAGQTWGTTELFPVQTVLESSFQSLAIDEAGTLYFNWAERRNGTARIFHAYNTDGGETWTEPALLLEAGASRTLPWAEARAPGELSLIWYGADSPGIPAEHETDWYLDHALVTETDTANPQATLERVTPEPVRSGTLCNDGPGCGEGEDRSLLDFPWVAMGPEGTAHLAFASTNWEQPSAFPMYAGEAQLDVGQAR